MISEKTYFINGLPALYQALKKEGREKEIENILRTFLQKSFNDDIDDKVKRFIDIPSASFIPANTEYFKLYSELMQLYTNGLYYSTVVLSGILCERICYDVLTKSRINVEEKPLSPEQTACFFEMNLAYLFQLLFDWGLIREETRRLMWEINQKRNEYVHPKKGKLDSQKDALEMMKKITRILVNEFQEQVEIKGTVLLPKNLEATSNGKTSTQ